MRRHFPHVAVIARARNRFHAYKLMDLGVEAPIRETWHGSLALAEDLLGRLGVAQAEARRAVERFAAHDEASLERQHAIYQDEAKLVESVQQAREELRSLFERDEAELENDERRAGRTAPLPTGSGRGTRTPD